MKKTLLLLASATLLLVGCAKEKFAEPIDGGMTSVTFSASVDGGVATKAAADNDGKGTNVNRCIMEIYFQDQLYKRMEAAMSGTPATATFSNVPVVAGKEYEILFWADCVDDAATAEGLEADKYYTTTSLKSVTVAKTAFIGALEAGDNDKLDAFCFAGNYTVPQNLAEPYSVTLKRPFAQLNVITTDVAEGKTVTSEDLLPEKVSVSYKAANTINVATGEISKVGNNAEDYTFTYEADVYGDWSTVATKHELTLSMDYLLASTEQGAVDVTFITKNGGQAVMTHNLTNLPYQRNYRTNVKGDLLTTVGTWTATVDPIWSSPDIVKVVEVADIKSANEIINQYKETTDHLEVKFTGEPSDSGEPAGEAAGIRAIVTTPIKEGNTLSIEVLTETKKLYIGDYKNEYIVSGEDFIDTDNSKHAVVNVNVPEESSITTLVINAPSKSVYINGKEVANVGTITNLDAITSQNTLIIEKGQTVNKLTIRQGGLEIHGTVGQAVVPEGHGIIVVRDCENLKETEVYDVLKEYIAEGYVGVKGRTTADLWDIVPEVCKIGTKSYGTLIDAVAAVQSGETINLVRDYEGDGVVVPGGKNFTLDFGGHTYKVIGNMAGSAGTQNQCFQLLKGSTLVFQNGTITTSCAKLGINTYSNVTIKNVTIDMSQTEATGQVACLETCNGTVSVEGESNLITKEDQIATLVLYWPNGGYGDINLTLNTTGEVNGLMAYGSYQVQDLSTVAQHSHVAIKNGKYDCTFDMDGLESYDYVISGGVFASKPDESLVADKYEVTENTDAATKDQYPWAVKISPEFVFVAKIGTTEYHTLSEALSAAKEGEAVYIIPDQLEETVKASNDNNIQLILDGKILTGDITFGGKGTLIVRAEELNTDYYHASKAYDVEAPTIPAQGVGGIMGKISATETATVMLRENLYSGPFEGNVELRGGFYYSGLGLDNIQAQTPNGIGLVVDEIKNVQGYDMYYVPEVPESYLVHIQNVLELMAAYAEGKVSDEQINQITLGYGLGERILQPWWVSVDGGDASLSPSGDNYFPNDVYAFFTNLKDGEYDNPKYAYQDWYCDYVISYSEPIKKDYQSGIWGYYSNMSIGCWLPASVTQTPFAMLSAVNMKRTYSQMLSDVGMFLCGPVNLNPDDKGTVITVKLNIYPDSQTDKCITTNIVVYTIPAISE